MGWLASGLGQRWDAFRYNTAMRVAENPAMAAGVAGTGLVGGAAVTGAVLS